MTIKLLQNPITTVAHLRRSYSALAPDVSPLTHLPVARALADARNNIPSRSAAFYFFSFFPSCRSLEHTNASVFLTAKQQ
jgi:hypothetical protein